MRRLALVLMTSVMLLSCFSGCMDDRIRRQVSLLNVKTKTAASEYDTAKTPEEKDVVAKAYFKDAPAMTQVIDDYAYRRKPQVTAPAPTVEKKGGLPGAVEGVGHKLKKFFIGGE